MKLLDIILKMFNLELNKKTNLYNSMVVFTDETHLSQIQRQGRLYEYLHNK
jgi:hypothetical protein